MPSNKSNLLIWGHENEAFAIIYFVYLLNFNLHRK